MGLQILGLLLLVSSGLSEIQDSQSSPVEPPFCYQDICDDGESILRGPVYQLGNFEDCVYRRKQQYCLTNIHLYPGDTPSQFWLHIQNMTSVRTHFRRDILYVGTCVPETSTAEDVSMAMDDMLEPAAVSVGVHTVIKVEPHNCQTRYHTPITTGDVIFGVVLLAILTAVIVATVYDSGCIKKDQHGTAQELLLSFSLIKNRKKMEASRSSRNLSSIEGIRTIISFIAVLMHTGYFTLIGALGNMEWLEQSYSSRYEVMLIHVHSHIIFFICTSGFLTGYNASRQLDDGNFTVVSYIKMVGRRYLRFTPIYMLLLAFSCTWLNYFGSGPLWPSLVTSEVHNCRYNWWINVLYLNNYINTDTQCMFHSWYIASDLQSYIFFLLMLFMMYKYQKWSRVITGVTLFTFIIIPFIQTYIERLDPTFLYIPESIRYMKEDLTFRRSYITFHGNASSYFIGVIFGCTFFKITKQGTSLSKGVVVTVWILSFALPIGSMFTFYELYRPEYEYNIFAVSVYAALHKPLYAVGVGSCLLGVCTGHGWIFRSIFSWKYFQTIAPYTYGIYLTHFILQRICAGNLKEPVTISMSYFIYKAAVEFVIALVLSVVLQLCVQLPVENLCQYSGAESLQLKRSYTALKKYYEKILKYK